MSQAKNFLRHACVTFILWLLSSVAYCVPDKQDWKTNTWPPAGEEFVIARQAIDKLKDKSRSDVQEYYEALSEKHKDDSLEPIVLFKMMYSLFHSVEIDRHGHKVKELYISLDESNLPLNKEVARMRFFVEAWILNKRDLIAVSKRLLNIFSEDNMVSYLAAIQLNRSKSISDKYKAYDLAETIIIRKPRKPEYQYLLGGICFGLFIETNSQGYAKQGYSAYTNFLQFGGSEHPWYERGQYWQKRMKNLIKPSSDRYFRDIKLSIA